MEVKADMEKTGRVKQGKADRCGPSFKPKLLMGSGCDPKLLEEGNKKSYYSKSTIN